MPLVSLHQSPAIGIWKMSESWQDMLELLQNKTMYAGEVQKIQSGNRKCEWLSVRLLVKHLTSADTPVCYQANGAPFLYHNPYHISISHTKGYAAIILSQYPHPGIDIEYRSERAWKLRRKFLSEKELALFAPSHDECPAGDEKHPLQAILHSANQSESKNAQPATLATICWCAKETAFKALQESAVDFIKHLHIQPFILSEKGMLSVEETKTNQRKTYHIHYQTTDDYIITWKA